MLGDLLINLFLMTLAGGVAVAFVSDAGLGLLGSTFFGSNFFGSGFFGSTFLCFSFC